MLIKDANALPRCPLCHKEFEEKYHPMGFFLYICKVDRIGIRTTDPMVGQWEKITAEMEPIPCPNPRCDATPMRIFTTSVDFMKAKCPKCATSMKNFNQGVKTPPPGGGSSGLPS